MPLFDQSAARRARLPEATHLINEKLPECKSQVNEILKKKRTLSEGDKQALAVSLLEFAANYQNSTEHFNSVLAAGEKIDKLEKAGKALLELQCLDDVDSLIAYALAEENKLDAGFRDWGKALRQMSADYVQVIAPKTREIRDAIKLSVNSHFPANRTSNRGKKPDTAGLLLASQVFSELQKHSIQGSKEETAPFFKMVQLALIYAGLLDEDARKRASTLVQNVLKPERLNRPKIKSQPAKRKNSGPK